MDNLNNRKFVGRLIFAVLTGRKNVREAIKLFPETKDPNITCAYHALVHYASDEEMRYQDIDYRELQDDFLEFIAQTLCDGKVLPQNRHTDFLVSIHEYRNVWHTQKIHP